MSQVPRFHATIIVISFAMGLLATTFSVAKRDPNTSVNTLLCNDESYGHGDPFGNSVFYVLSDLINYAPTKDGYNYYTVSPYPTSVAYGHATCSQSLAIAECQDCLVSAEGTLDSECLTSIGAQVGMVDCSMRYENYPFA